MSAFDPRSLAFSITIVSVAWGIVAVVWLIPWMGPLAAFVFVPWIASLVILSVWDFLIGLVYRHFGQSSRTARVIRVAPATLLACAIVGIPAIESLPRNQLRSYVVSPVPNSVTAVKIGGEKAFLYEHTAMYFKIAPNDFAKLLVPYSYRKVRRDPSILEEYAQEFLQMSLDELGEYDIYEAELLAEGEMDSGMPITKTIVVNKQHDRVMFFHLFDN